MQGVEVQWEVAMREHRKCTVEIAYLSEVKMSDSGQSVNKIPREDA